MMRATRYNYQDIVTVLRSKKLMSVRELEIWCNTIKAISYQDIIELYLSLSRVIHLKWIDSEGAISCRQPLLKIIMNLFRDMLNWPFIYTRKSEAISQLLKKAAIKGVRNKGVSVLFLRTDHWFNVKSGGSVGHLNGVVHGLRTLGYETHVVSTDYLVGVERDKYFHLCHPVYDMGRNLPNVPELLYNDQLVRFLEKRWEWSPSFIYQRYSLGNYTGVLLKQKYDVPYVCEYNGSFPWMARHWNGRKLFHEKLITRIELLNLQTADLVIVVSQPMKDELIERGIKAEKILVNPNGVNPERYSPAVDGSGIRSKYNLGNKTVIGFIGTFGKWHGAKVLAKAVRHVISEKREVHSLFIGDGVTMPEVKNIVKGDKVSEYVTFTGLIPQDEAPEYLAACDILVSPHVPNPDGTPFFGSPTKLFEYMAMGKAIVASDLDQIGEVLEHKKTAWMVKPGDVKSLMVGLKTLIEDEQLRDRFGRAARQEVVAKYTWQEHTRKIIEKLKELLESNE